MKFIFKLLPLILAFGVNMASAQENTPTHALAPGKVINFIEDELQLQYPTTKDAGMLELSPVKAQKLLASADGQGWVPYGAQGPTCDDAPKSKAKTAGQRAQFNKELKSYRTKCLPIKKACAEVVQFGEKYNVVSTCSKLYPVATILLTTAPKPAYTNPNSAALNSPSLEDELPPK